MKTYSSFKEWKKDQSVKNKKLILMLEQLVKKVAPDFTTTSKWGQGCFVDNNILKMYIHAEPDYIQFGFYQGASLKDEKKILQGKGKYVRHIKLYTLRDIDEVVLGDFIKQVLI